MENCPDDTKEYTGEWLIMYCYTWSGSDKQIRDLQLTSSLDLVYIRGTGGNGRGWHCEWRRQQPTGPWRLQRWMNAERDRGYKRASGRYSVRRPPIRLVVEREILRWAAIGLGTSPRDHRGEGNAVGSRGPQPYLPRFVPIPPSSTWWR